MAKIVFLIVLGALVGASIGMINIGGDIGRKMSDGLAGVGITAARLMEAPRAAPVRTAGASDPSHFVFSSCLHRTGASVEQTLVDLVEFHEHDATLALVGCLLEGEPARFCTPAGRQQAADAMEIYFWSREDARRTTPAHGLAEKIHALDRVAAAGHDAETPDLFVFSWSGPKDTAIFDKLKTLVKQGYLDPGAFAFSGRAELRDALRGVTPGATPCIATAQR